MREWLRLNLVKFGDIAAFGGILLSVVAIACRLLGIPDIFGIQVFHHFVAGMWLMLLGALIRLEILLTVGKERTYHPELTEKETRVF